MTLIVGILCTDGVVIASDSAATFGAGSLHTIGQQHVQKVVKVNANVLYASTGAVGMSQLISDRIGKEWKGNGFKNLTTAPSVMDKVGKDINGIVAPYLQTAQMQRNLTGDASTSLCKSLLAMPVGKTPHLFQFDFNGAPEQATPKLPFVSLGSGQLIADPFLAFIKRLLWPSTQPTLAEGRLAAVWTIDHVTRTNPGGVGGPIQLATLSLVAGNDPVAEIESEEAVQEHRQSALLAEQALVNQIKGDVPADQPPVAPPEA